MLIGVILAVKVNWEKKHAPYITISLNKAIFIKVVAVAVLHTYIDQTSVL